MADAAREFGAALTELTLHPPSVPVVSAVTGALLTDEQAVSAEFWSRQLTEPVDFERAMRTFLAHGPLSLIEVGPSRTIIGLARRRPDVRESRSQVFATVPYGQGDARPGRRVLGELLAQLWVDGEPVSYWRDAADGRYRRVAVPGYPYQRRRYWLDRPAAAAQPAAADGAVPAETGQPASPAAATGGAAPETAATRRWRFAALEWFPDRSSFARPVPVPSPPAGAAVLLVPEDPDLARIAQSAVQRAGYRTVRVGDRARADDRRASGPPTMAIDPARPEDWLAILEKAAEATPGPVLLGHAALLGADWSAEPGAQLGAGVTALLAALRAAATFQRRHQVPVRVLLLGRGMVDVTGAEPLNPAAAALPALLRSAERELPGVRCQAVDIADRVVDDLLAETLTEPDPPLVALRGRCLWQPRLRALTRSGTGASLVRPHGTYLITGGFGGLGMVVAQALAETGLGPRLALLGRSGLDGLAEPDRTAAHARLDDLAAAGAEVRAYACDVGDAAALATVVDQVQDVFGPVHGVIHAAGVPGGGLLERRSADEIREVLHPKIAGVLALDTVFTGRPPLDFMMLFSSHAGLTGMYGSADYAVANAFLDAHARLQAADGRRIVSVQWPGWAEVGMLARSDTARAVLGAGRAAAPAAEANGTTRVALQVTRSPDRDWEFLEHAFAGTPVLPGTALLEFAVLAAKTVGIPDSGGGLELRGTAFLAPVVGDQPREVRVLLTPMADMHQFRVQARAAGSDESWTDHATGTLGPADGIQAPDLPELTARLPSRARPSLAGWMEFGARWDTMTEARGDDNERLARLKLPERYHADLADHPLHPAIFDVAAGVLSDVTPGHKYAPFLYRRVVVLAPLTADVTVHTRFTAADRRPRPVDFDVYDTHSSALLARAESFSIREVATAGLAVAATRPTGPSGSQRAADGLLLPEEGASAFLELLNAGTPPVTLVTTSSTQFSVPGVPWADAVRTDGKPDRPPQRVQSPAETGQTVAPAPVPAAAAADTERATPGEDSVTAGLRRLWADALGISDISEDDDFFELGGNSMNAVQLAAQVSDHFGIELGAGSLFDAATLRALAAEIRAVRQAAG
jgi:acyl transferase domain-containing protein/acyl carrier protein